MIDTLSAPAFKSDPDIVETANPASHGQRHGGTDVGRAANDVEQDRPIFVAGGDVQKHQLIGTLLVITRCHFDRIASVFEVKEIGPLDHAPVINVEARDDPLGQHGQSQS